MCSKYFKTFRTSQTSAFLKEKIVKRKRCQDGQHFHFRSRPFLFPTSFFCKWILRQRTPHFLYVTRLCIRSFRLILYCTISTCIYRNIVKSTLERASALKRIREFVGSEKKSCRRASPN